MSDPDEQAEGKDSISPESSGANEPGLRDQAEDDESPEVLRNLEELQRIAEFHLLVGSAARPPASDCSGVGSGGALANVPESQGSRTTPADIDQPFVWGKLEVRRRLGQGAGGEVVLAHDPDLKRDIALKLYRPMTVPAADDEARRNSILREARLMAKVRHPNVITVHGAEVHDQRVGIRMDYIHGETLAQILQRRVRMGAEEAIVIGLELCRALAAVHARHLVHQDVKPQNVMREDGGRIVLMDFGVGIDTSDPLMPLLAAGSPLYQAPEALLAGQVSTACDIYSLGVLLFQMVTGTLPVEAEDLRSLLAHHKSGQRTLLRDIRADLPRAFLDVVEKALAVDPVDRYRTMGEMEAALAAAGGRPVVVKKTASPRWLVFGLVGLAIAAGSLAIWQVGLSRRFVQQSHPEAYSPATKAEVEFAMAQQNLGSFYLNMGRLTEATAKYREALFVLRRALGDRAPLVATAMYNVGKTYAVREKLTRSQSDSAASMLLACSELQARLFGKDSPDRASTLSDLGVVYEISGDNAKAEKCYKQALAMRSTRLGSGGREDAPTPGRERSEPSDPNPERDKDPVATGSSGDSLAGAEESDRYRYEVGFSRYLPDAKRFDEFLPLSVGGTVSVGDNIFMRIWASIPLYVYVLNRDEAGNEYVLFPLPGVEYPNPLPARRRVELPGRIGGTRTGWSVRQVGIEERFLIVTSPRPVREIEELAVSMRTPSTTGPEMPLSAQASVRLRGVGGLSEIPADEVIGPQAATRGAVEAYLTAASALSPSGEQASGVAFRKFWLRNP